MKKLKHLPEVTCVCGRKRADAAIYVYRSHEDRFVFHRCECGAEWTEHLFGADPAEPVSCNEVIEVHALLQNFEGSFKELLAART